MEPRSLTKPILYGFTASLLLLAVYFSALSLISGWMFAKIQFASFWSFIVILALGFGVQIALYQVLKERVRAKGTGKVVGASGATSTAAMISCCAHYLANILPALGATGLVTFVAAYQIQLFWVGIFLNLIGIGFLMKKLITIRIV